MMGMHSGGWFSYMRGASTESEKPQVTRKLLLRVLGYALPYRRQIIGLLLTILLTTGLGLLMPLIFRDLIDNVLVADGDDDGPEWAGAQAVE